MENALGTKEIIKAKVTLVFTGYGWLTLTDAALFWNKSATSYLTFGVLNVATSDHVCIPLTEMERLEHIHISPVVAWLLQQKQVKNIRLPSSIRKTLMSFILI